VIAQLALVLAVGATTYATRLSGFLLHGHVIPPALNRFLAYVPIAAFAALLAPGLGLTNGQLLPRLAGAAVAVLVVLRTRQLWAGLATGMALYWLVSALIHIN
jgi:branched-subunit amino acid transport protein